MRKKREKTVGIKIEARREIRTKISGVTWDDPHSGLNRQWIIKKYVRPGTALVPGLEPDNPHDPNAVGLWLERRGAWSLRKKRFHLGYLNKILARQCAQLLRNGEKLDITVTEVTGGGRKRRTRGVNVVIRYRGGWHARGRRRFGRRPGGEE